MPMHFLSIVLLLIRARVCDGANEIKKYGVPLSNSQELPKNGTITLTLVDLLMLDCCIVASADFVV